MDGADTAGPPQVDVLVHHDTDLINYEHVSWWEGVEDDPLVVD